ncbi:MAG: hypothetical protein E6Q95_02355 [Chitinophagaceae bacterium]|nr:MAG: hypothetical protein E6Q95_02355 [Chitinophagaceae bacterium]
MSLKNVQAQVHSLADTLSLIAPDFYSQLKAQRAKKSKSDSLYFFDLNKLKTQFSQKNMTFLLADTSLQAAVLSIGYLSSKKDLREPYQAYKSTSAQLFTEGFTTIGKVKMMGKMYFNKSWEDSLANNLMGEYNNGAPFSFFATKAGKFERQNLNFEAGLSYPLAKNIFVHTVFDYNYHWSTGSVDPRPDNKIFQMKAKPGLSFRWGHTFLGASYLVGKTDKDFDIVYKNRMFAQSQLYPDRRLYINNGYGSISQLTTAVFTSSVDKISAWELSLHTKIANWNVNLNYNNDFSKTNNFSLITNEDSVNSPIKKLTHSRYELAQQNLHALLITEGAKTRHLIDIKGSIHEGTALLNAIPTGANYLFDEHRAAILYLASINKLKSISYELGTSTAFHHFNKKDFLSRHFYNHSNVYVSLLASKYIYFKKNIFKSKIQSGLVLPIVNQLEISKNQVNVFTNNTVYPEYHFYGSGFIKLDMGLMYFTPNLLGFAGSAFSFNLNFVKKIKDSDLSKTLLNQKINGSQQSSISVGYQIYL